MVSKPISKAGSPAGAPEVSSGFVPTIDPARMDPDAARWSLLIPVAITLSPMPPPSGAELEVGAVDAHAMHDHRELARERDQRWIRISITWAASNRATLTVASQARLMAPSRSISPDWLRLGVRPKQAPTELGSGESLGLIDGGAEGTRRSLAWSLFSRLCLALSDHLFDVLEGQLQLIGRGRLLGALAE